MIAIGTSHLWSYCDSKDEGSLPPDFHPLLFDTLTAISVTCVTPLAKSSRNGSFAHLPVGSRIRITAAASKRVSFIHHQCVQSGVVRFACCQHPRVFPTCA